MQLTKQEGINRPHRIMQFKSFLLCKCTVILTRTKLKWLSNSQILKKLDICILVYTTAHIEVQYSVLNFQCWPFVHIVEGMMKIDHLYSWGVWPCAQMVHIRVATLFLLLTQWETPQEIDISMHTQAWERAKHFNLQSMSSPFTSTIINQILDLGIILDILLV